MHKRQKGALELFFCALFFIAVSLRPLSACSIAVTSFEVTDHFVVDVFNRGERVPGLVIELRAFSKRADNRIDERVVLTRTTDEHGEAAFTAIRSGNYTVTIKHEAFPKLADVFVKKHASKSAESRITFEWPASQILHVKSVSGLLNGQIKTEMHLYDKAHHVFQPLTYAKMTLLDAVSGQVIESQTASESGAFGFRTSSEGLYILRVELPPQGTANYRDINGYIPIEIAPAADVTNLNLFLSQGLCGSVAYQNGEGAIR